jgi:hypothetical protein
MEKREDAVLDMDIYRFERNGARENAGSNPEDVSTGGLFSPTMSISPPPPSGLLVSGGGLTVGLPNSPVTQRGLSGCSSSLSL